MFSHKTYLKPGEFKEVDINSLLKNDYEVANCEFSFQQGIDEKGKASTEVFGGSISLILPTFPSNEIIDWALNSHRYKSGLIITLDANNEPLSKLFFKNATCISMLLSYTQKGKSYASTNIILQAEELLFGNGVDFSNNWVK
jgi:hypothetical protein